MKILRRLLTTAALTAVFSLPFTAFAQTSAPAPKTTAPKAAVKTTAPTDAEIANAKAKGLVWVNTSTKAYHKSDDKYFGKTAHGKFMSAADADKAGYHLAGVTTPKKATTPATPPAK